MARIRYLIKTKAVIPSIGGTSPIGGNVFIVDQDGNLIATVPSPSSYQVTVFTGVRDNVIGGNDVTILDNIL